MNIYELVVGQIRHYVAAKDETDAYNQGTDPERFPEMHYRPFEIRLVEVEGYKITLEKVAKEVTTTVPDMFDDMDKDQLKEYLTERGIEFNSQLGEKKLKALAREATN